MNRALLESNRSEIDSLHRSSIRSTAARFAGHLAPRLAGRLAPRLANRLAPRLRVLHHRCRGWPWGASLVPLSAPLLQGLVVMSSAPLRNRCRGWPRAPCHHGCHRPPHCPTAGTAPPHSPVTDHQGKANNQERGKRVGREKQWGSGERLTDERVPHVI
jgi:hypothetical protein